MTPEFGVGLYLLIGLILALCEVRWDSGGRSDDKIEEEFVKTICAWPLWVTIIIVMGVLFVIIWPINKWMKWVIRLAKKKDKDYDQKNQSTD